MASLRQADLSATRPSDPAASPSETPEPLDEPAGAPSGDKGRSSRRRLLAAAAGGVGAWVAGSLGAASPAEAAAGQSLLMGKTTNSAGTSATKMSATSAATAFTIAQLGTGTAVYGVVSATSGAGRGVYGRTASPAGDGVLAVNAAASASTGTALHAVGNKNTGLKATSEQTAVDANGGYTALQAYGTTYGGILQSAGTGAYASGGVYGVYAAASTTGVYGSGSTGVNGVGGTTGVYGYGPTGVRGTTGNGAGDSVLGDGGQYGVHGMNASTAGVLGESGYVGVWGEGATYGVFGHTSGTTGGAYGVMGSAGGSAWAVYSLGNAGVQGTLSKLAGSFKIDHPLDPTRKWLSHSFVESPDMMNVYNGVADLDAAGRATVQLPAYFGALNRDFRYQLTAIGQAAPDLHVASEVARNRFVIAGGTPNGRVSWQVTGIRQDAYAKAHPIVVETAKDADETGSRIFVPRGSRARQWLPHPARPAAMRRAPAPAMPKPPSLKATP